MNHKQEEPVQIEELLPLIHENITMLQKVTENLVSISNILLESYRTDDQLDRDSFSIYTLKYLRYAFQHDPEKRYELLTCNVYTKSIDQLKEMIQCLSSQKRPLREARDKVMLEYLQENPFITSEIASKIFNIESYTVHKYLYDFYNDWKHYLFRTKRGRVSYLSWKPQKEEEL